MLGRGGRDYSDRDAAVLNLLRAQIAASFDAMMLRAALTEALSAQSQALEDSGRGVVLVSTTGRVVWSSARAEQWLRDYLPAAHGAALPAQVGAWLAAQRAGTGR